MRKHPLIVFFILAFLLPWLVWGTTLARQYGWLSWHVPAALAFWLGLTIAAYAAAALTGGRAAVKDLLLRLIRVRVGAKPYVMAVLFTPVLAAAALGIGALFGLGAAVGQEVPAGALPALLLLNVWLFLITEETAWRGFALPRLQALIGPLYASVLLGVLWGLWHIPLFLIAGTFQSTIPFAGFLISAVATSVTISWIFNRSRGSVLVAALFHAVTDVALGFTAVMNGGGALFWIIVTLQVAAAALLAPSLRVLPRGGRGELLYGSPVRRRLAAAAPAGASPAAASPATAPPAPASAARAGGDLAGTG